MDELRNKFEANHQYLNLTHNAIGGYTHKVVDQCWTLYQAHHAPQPPRPEIKIGSIYEHYSGTQCRIVGIVAHPVTGEKFITYANKAGTHLDISETRFHEQINRGACRFTLVEEAKHEVTA